MRKLCLGKEVVSLRLVVTEVSRGGGILEPTRWSREGENKETEQVYSYNHGARTVGREGDTVKPLFLAALNFGV